MSPTALGPSAPPISGNFERLGSPSPFLGSAAGSDRDELSNHDELYQHEGFIKDISYFEPWPVRHAKKMGCVVRDFAYEDGRLPPVRPVWMQQHQPVGPESQGQQILTVMRPKTPEVYIVTPTLTPNGSYIWANPEEEALAASQQQATHDRVQIALEKLQAQAAEAVITTPSFKTPPTATAPIPSTSSKPSQAAPTTPLVMRVSVVIVSHSAKSKQKGRAVPPDYLSDARASKRPRRGPGKSAADELPPHNYPRGKSTVVPPSTRVLRSHVRGSTPASSSTTPHNTRTPLHPSARSRPRRS
ncbi:hypothetical protein EST38_g11016 [Candolleomyces aberdarensis]|uniref:Uncharacterized protein n=1 Tax=Candolleomyces aberdarensis TaxID=2316362 RepID=A0A4V1Q2E8_9AGAR|nr:hypothetical protein EST38_g11016 [Candolleomyces aberdarensis]